MQLADVAGAGATGASIAYTGIGLGLAAKTASSILKRRKHKPKRRSKKRSKAAYA